MKRLLQTARTAQLRATSTLQIARTAHLRVTLTVHIKVTGAQTRNTSCFMRSSVKPRLKRGNITNGGRLRQIVIRGRWKDRGRDWAHAHQHPFCFLAARSSFRLDSRGASPTRSSSPAAQIAHAALAWPHLPPRNSRIHGLPAT